MRKVAVITGASRGLGAHLADALAQDGYSLALGARDLKKASRLWQSSCREKYCL